MTSTEIIRRRLLNQHLAAPKYSEPQDIVRYMGAMQAQEFAMAKWAIGLRLKEANETTVEQAFNEGKILRTHIMRPTWHFVAPEDIRWMQQLTAPRVHAFCAYMYRKVGLDQKMLRRGSEILGKALQGGKFLTRPELVEALQKKKITADNLQMVHYLIFAELENIVCSGPRVGKQFTYALLDERAPQKAAKFNRDEALAKLAERYFASRGPATAQDFSWWSGLTVTDAKKGAASLPKKFASETINGQTYFYLPDTIPAKTNLPATFLLPDYDEYGIAYKDRSAFIDKEKLDPKAATHLRDANPIFNRLIIVDGKLAGGWQRSILKNTVEVKTNLVTKLNPKQQKAVDAAIVRFTEFVGAETAIKLEKAKPTPARKKKN